MFVHTETSISRQTGMKMSSLGVNFSISKSPLLDTKLLKLFIGS